MSGWRHRVRRPVNPPLHEVQAAARNLAEHIAPGKGRLIFQAITDVTVLGTVAIGGAWAAVHLYRALFPRHKEILPSRTRPPWPCEW